VPKEWTLENLMMKMCHLPNLRSLDFGMDSSFFLHIWRLPTIEAPLTYLRITISAIITITRVMLSEPLRHTLKQLHIKLNDLNRAPYLNISSAQLLARMEALHTFTFFKSFQWHFEEEWTYLDVLTSSRVMPVLRRINFSIVIDTDDLYQMNHSALFTDYRHIDVHYAFIVNDNRPHNELNKYVSSGRQFHPRKIASATFISETWPDNQPFTTPGQYYVSYH